MHYQSPIRLFDYCTIDYNNPDINRIKKILSAEFFLSEEGIISIDGFDYSKNDILQELENENFPQRLEFHNLIWNEKSLLNFLEKNEIHLPEAEKWKILGINDKAFISFISPYFAIPFDKIMRKFLNLVDFNKASEWLDFLIFINNPEDEEKALAGTRSFLADFTKSLKNVNNVTYKSIQSKITPWIQQPCYLFINKLPSSLYDSTDDLVRTLINFTASIQFVNKTLCYSISCQLIRINCAAIDLQKLIQSNHEIYRSKASRFTLSKWVTYAIYGFMILFFLYVVSIIVFKTPHEKSKRKDNLLFTDSISLHYANTRNEYSNISWDSTRIIKNQDIVLHDALYYLMIENQTSKNVSALKFKNNTKLPIILHIADDNLIILDLLVNPYKDIYLEVNDSRFDFMFKVKTDHLKKPITTDSIIPILISDSLNISPHKINFDSNKKVIHIDNPKKVYDFTIEINTASNTHENYLTIKGNTNWVVKK